MSKERELLRKILRDTQYINYECNDKIRNEIVEFLAQPETCDEFARMPVGIRSIAPPNQQGIAQMAHMCSDAEYAAFRKRIGLDE